MVNRLERKVDKPCSKCCVRFVSVDKICVITSEKYMFVVIGNTRYVRLLRPRCY